MRLIVVFCFLAILVLSCSGIPKLPSREELDWRYTRAYKYIRSDTTARNLFNEYVAAGEAFSIEVATELIPSTYVPFADNLARWRTGEENPPKGVVTSISDSLRQIDATREAFSDHDKKRLNRGHEQLGAKKENFLLFFSPPFKRSIHVELVLLNREENGDISYQQATRNSVGLRVLILFDDEHEVRKAFYWGPIQYE